MPPHHFPKCFFAYLDILGFSRFVLNMNKLPEFRDDPIKKQKQLLDYYSVLEPLVMGPVYGKGKITTNDEVASIVKTEKPKLNSYIVTVPSGSVLCEPSKLIITPGSGLVLLTVRTAFG